MTATATRTDAHRPSAVEFNPADYVCVGVFDTHPEDGDNAARGRMIALLTSNGARFDGPYGRGFQCGHCGAHLRYVALMRHTSDTLIYVGETCLDGTFSLDTAESFRSLRAAAAEKAAATREANRRHEIAAQIADYIEGLGDERLAELTYLGNGGIADNNDFVGDVARKLFRYGTLTSGQINALGRAISRDAAYNGRRDEQDRADAARKAVASPAPTGRVEITGKILNTYTRDTQYGVAFKMRVQADAGYVVFSTIPAALLNEDTDIVTLADQRITFTATLTVSDDDDTVAFANRPSKARRV